MSKLYKKYGTTTGGYRGERAILKERVIEGLEKSAFSDLLLQLTADSPQTIYLTDSNFGEGQYIVLPDATNLWPNWKVSIINETSHSCNIYYYTSNYSQLNLFKELSGGNMTTCILLDDSTSEGKWTTLRTSEQSSTDLLSKYTTNVFETVNITWSELQQDDSDESDEHITIKIPIAKILAGTAVRSIYLKTANTFEFDDDSDSDTSNSLFVSIGTDVDDDHFVSSYDLTSAVSDNNFTKDYFEEILSTSADTDIYAYFKGSYLNQLNAGSLKIVVEKAREIDPTILKNAIVQTQLPIGTIMNYSFDDIPNGFWRLDGSIVPNAATAIPQFVEKLNKTNDRLIGEKLIVTRTEWENYNTQYGSCGKFCWVGSGLRFPKINCFIEGLFSLSELGHLNAPGLPNITGTLGPVRGRQNTSSSLDATGAFSVTQSNTGGGQNTETRGASLVTFDASKSNPIYGRSNTVQPKSVKFPYIISIYNKIQTESEIVLNELLEDSVNKANINLDNITTAEPILNAMAADFNSFSTIAYNTTFTAPYSGWISYTPAGNTDTSGVFNGGANGYIQVGGKTVLTSTFVYGSDSSHPDSCWVFVGKGQTVYHTMTSGIVYYYMCKGV